MKLIIYIIPFLFSINLFAQNDTTLITTSRNEEIPLQAVVNLASIHKLYAGKEYMFEILTSGYFDIRVTFKNAKVKLIEESKRQTGGLRYLVTPVEPGPLSISVFNVTDKGRQVSLLANSYWVSNSPPPNIRLTGLANSQIISNLKDSTTLQCSYPIGSGLFVKNYKVVKWSATIGDKNFTGEGDLLSKELIQYINNLEKGFLHLKITLDENNTGHLNSEAVYLIRPDNNDE